MRALKKLLVGTGIAAMGVGGYIVTRPKPAPFHVAYPPLKIKVPGCDDAFPFVHFMMSNIPESMRKKLVVKMGAPKPNELKDRSVTRCSFRFSKCFHFSPSFLVFDDRFHSVRRQIRLFG